MSFLETVEKARAFLQRNGRVSLRALKLEFQLDDDQLEALVEELVDIQQVAARDGKAVAWTGGTLRRGAAESVTTSPAPMPTPGAEAERRQLTVMFCDLVGSTELSQTIDPEDFRSIVLAYHESAAGVIDRFDGHVIQYLGDGVLVCFGYPRAHEDDAERGVRAGLEILTTLGSLNDRLEPEYGVRLSVRVGIHTGLVVVGEMEGERKGETLALGETMNIAAALRHAI